MEKGTERERKEEEAGKRGYEEEKRASGVENTGRKAKEGNVAGLENKIRRRQGQRRKETFSGPRLHFRQRHIRVSFRRVLFAVDGEAPAHCCGFSSSVR